MSTFYVYIVECADNSYYTGITNNIEKRLAEHKRGLVTESYTYSRRPIKLMFCQAFEDPSTAIEQEKRIKGWTRKKKEALIEGIWGKLRELAECLNESSHKNFEGYPSTPLRVTKKKRMFTSNKNGLHSQ